MDMHIALVTHIATAAIAASSLPLGDGRTGSTAHAGYIDTCQTSFMSGGPGAFRDGPWIHGSTWDSTAKISVSGSVSWAGAKYSNRVSGSRRLITTSSLPVDGLRTGTFPVASSDEAYSYDR